MYTQESRTKKVAELMAQLHSSSLVLGMDSRETTNVVVNGGGVQVQAGDISDGAIAGLAAGIERLREIKRSRMEKVRYDTVAVDAVEMQMPPRQLINFVSIVGNE